MEASEQRELIIAIKKKAELAGIADSVVVHTLAAVQKRIGLPRTPAEKKVFVKEVRAQLRRFVGRFQANGQQRQQLLEAEDIHALLATHASSAERLPHYHVLKEKIATLHPSSILDLGCGLNPLALAQKEIPYHAADIREDELALIKTYFKKNSIRGTVFMYDFASPDAKTLPIVDICLLLKVLDTLDTRGHKRAEKLIRAISASRFLISFSTKTLSGKPMNHPQRGWIEQLLHRLGFSFTTFSIPNEIFYLAEKKQRA